MQSRQIALETEGLLRRYNGEQREADSAGLWQTILTKKGRFKELTGQIFHAVPDVGEGEKSQLKHLFLRWRGCAWRNKFGWIGVANLFAPLEAPAPYFEGIATELSPAPTASQVLEINLSGIGCNGDLAQAELKFPACRLLDLQLNSLCSSTCISLSGMPCLVHVDFSGNVLSFDVADLSLEGNLCLTYVNLSNNDIHGQLSPSLFHAATQLQILDLSNNRIAGCLPTFLGTDLTFLNLSNNRLEGDIPSSYSALTHLEELLLSHNRLSGHMESCYSLTRLRHLALNHNTFSGRIGDEIRALTQMQFLYLQCNRFDGWLPSGVSALLALKCMDVSSNALGHRLPEDVGKLTELRVLRACDNHISGPLPESVSALTNLRHIHVFDSYPSDTTTFPLQFDSYHLYGCADDPSQIEEQLDWLKRASEKS